MPTSQVPADARIDALIERFPRIFKGTQSYAWSALPPGWTQLAERLFADIDRVLDDEAARAFEVRQIKEEFGALRVYWRFAKEENTAIDVADRFDTLILDPVDPTPLFAQIRARVKQARVEAASTCQYCGNSSAEANISEQADAANGQAL